MTVWLTMQFLEGMCWVGGAAGTVVRYSVVVPGFDRTRLDAHVLTKPASELKGLARLLRLVQDPDMYVR